MKKSADATIDAALAAKKSADIAGALHRSFMSLGGIQLRSGRGTPGVGNRLFCSRTTARNPP
jgi:hypothetical protein